MYIAKGYFDTKFKKSFKKGDVVPSEIAEVYSRYVTKESEDELLVETPSAVDVVVESESDLIEDKIEDKIDDLEEVKGKKVRKKVSGTNPDLKGIINDKN